MRKAKLVFVLVSAFGPFLAPLDIRAQGGRGAQVELPDGKGKELVQALCVGCHNLGNITQGWGYDKKDWDELIASMVALPPDARNQVTTYLGEHFSAKSRPATVAVPGALKVDIQEWIVPSLGSRPHDPLATSDGAIWWTGMFANVLGRLDPKTGAMKEYPLKTPKSGPHGLTEGKDGSIWFTANTAGYVGKLNPKTGDITEYKMPDPAARDPHTPVFDVKGNLWFTVQGGNMVGRLNPETGAIKLVTMPTPRSNPYGMVMTSNGTPVVCLFGTNKIVSFDLETMAGKEYVLPNASSRPRRIAITSDDQIWYADYSRGYLGRLNLATGAVKEWPSPSGPQSQPYGIIAINDVIWYNESSVRPNTLVRFDPRTEKFQSWPIPSGGGVVRNMSVTPDKNLAMAESGVNRVALVKLPSAGAPVSTASTTAPVDRTPSRSPQPMSPVQGPQPYQTTSVIDLARVEAQGQLSTVQIAAQQASRVDHSPLSSSVQVGQDQGNIILRGTVPDEATRIRVEQAARDATTAGNYIDNQIRVEPR